MNVTINNALIVSKLFLALSDARFQMRTPVAIRKVAGMTPEQFSDADIANLAGELGIRIRTRMRDGALLVQRPAILTAEEAATISQRAEAVLGGAESFDASYVEPEPQVAATDGLGTAIENALGNPEGEDEDQILN